MTPDDMNKTELVQEIERLQAQVEEKIQGWERAVELHLKLEKQLKDDVWFGAGGAEEVPHDEQDILILVVSNFQRLITVQKELAQAKDREKQLADELEGEKIRVLMLDAGWKETIRQLRDLESANARLRQLLIDGEDFARHQRRCPEGNCLCGFNNWHARKEAALADPPAPASQRPAPPWPTSGPDKYET